MWMSRTLALTLSIFALAGCAEAEQETAAAAQESAIDAPPSVSPTSAMAPLAFLVGTWSGSGSIRLGPGAPKTFHETETIEPRLDGVTLTLDGRGTDASGAVVHDAFGVLFVDDQQKIKMRWFTGDGTTGESAVVVGASTLTWSIDGPRKARFTITVGPDGTWTETGEASSGGTTWFPFFSMTLARREAQR